MSAAVRWFLCFMIYSFVGWAYESAVCSVEQRKPVNRGFLVGPVCPVYGFGALVSILFLYDKTDKVLLLFLAGMALTCAVEYITSVLLEKIFHARWWDYSQYRFNINGRVSLLGAVVFGVLSVLLVRYVHPFVLRLIEWIPDHLLIVITAVVFVVLTVDLSMTIGHLLSLNSKLQEIQAAINTYVSETKQRAGEIKSVIADKFEESRFYSERIKVLIQSGRFHNNRLLKAFPSLRSIRYEEAWQKIKNMLLR